MSIDMCERTYIYVHMYINYRYLFSQAEFSCLHSKHVVWPCKTTATATAAAAAAAVAVATKANKYGAHMCRKRLTVICEGKQTKTRRTHTHTHTDILTHPHILRERNVLQTETCVKFVWEVVSLAYLALITIVINWVLPKIESEKCQITKSQNAKIENQQIDNNTKIYLEYT